MFLGRFNGQIKKLHDENMKDTFKKKRKLHEWLPNHSRTPCKRKHHAGISSIGIASETYSLESLLTSQNVKIH